MFNAALFRIAKKNKKKNTLSIQRWTCSMTYGITVEWCVCTHSEKIMFSETFQRHEIMLRQYYEAKAE